MRLLLITMAIFSMFGSLGKSQPAPGRESISYRPPALAGKFYPLAPEKLQNMIYEYLDTAKPQAIHKDIIAIVVPHAGYVYSGVVAGRAYREIRGRAFDAVVVVGPSHRQYFNGASVFNGDAYVTPLGNAMVDKELARLIAESNDGVYLSSNGHTTDESDGENSIETQIPFLQTVLPNIPIVPIAVGEQDFNSSDKLMKALAHGIIKYGKRVLLVASTDLSHYHDLENARNLDIPVVKTFARYDYFKLANMLFSRKHEACGSGPLIAVMLAAEQLGATSAQPLLYQTSASSPAGKGQTDKVVGYFAGAMTRHHGEDNLQLPRFTENDVEELKNAAMKGVQNAIDNTEPQKNLYLPKNLAHELPAFVTLKKDGILRGCMGHTFTHLPLLEEVENSGKLAAESDPRFGPVKNHELEKIQIEITVMSRLKRVLDFEEIVPGEDGVFLKLGSHSGLFLPQVATEQNWDRTELLENLGKKAGLNKDSYKEQNSMLFKFKSIIIH